MNLSHHIRSLLPGPFRRDLPGYKTLVQKITKVAECLRELSDADLRQQSLALRYRAKSREPLKRLLPEAYALVCETADRQLGMRHYKVQLLGGIALHFGTIAEMQTGEGKTLTATLPLYLNALIGKGAHLATANDYLARRDTEWMRPIYESLGLSVGVIESRNPPSDRRVAYACDITYGTAKEFGFDFLRDRLQLRSRNPGLGDSLASMLGQQPDKSVEQALLNPRCHFALVDEADSILIDEARTPLIISATMFENAQVAEACFCWAAKSAGQFHDSQHYDYDPENKTVNLNSDGRAQLRSLAKPPLMDSVNLPYIREYVERAIKVQRDFIRDRHYVVHDNDIVIVDEFTGRLAEGRKWRGGIHQAIEAKEGLNITAPSGQAAQITVQELFSRYERLSGMTGTASSSARELKKVYGTRVIPIPTNRPSRRVRLPDRIFATQTDKWTAVVEEVKEMLADGRPVLIGTRSIDKSEALSRLLSQSGIKHRVLNARRLAEEAGIVSEAGRPDNVTVATNMAGRGTDIQLAPRVAEKGGLHVIGTEMHDSTRIDRQLAGRCARQGDLGSFRQLLSLDDDILATGFGRDKADKIRSAHRQSSKLDHLTGLFHEAQARVEREHFKQRRILMHYVAQRTTLQTQLGQDPYLDTPDQ